MADLIDLLLRPFAVATLWLLRALLWFGLELMFSTIGWGIGWCVCRVLTLGRLPSVGIKDEERYDFLPRVAVELVGLASLALLIWGLAAMLNA
ncbi:hypothetical protein [Rhodoferax sp.]|uniref:hypothetical protein n=1 Tax=Rhodoferax sp. TaxID=50421 RepID=UPI0037830DBF